MGKQIRNLQDLPDFVKVSDYLALDRNGNIEANRITVELLFDLLLQLIDYDAIGGVVSFKGTAGPTDTPAAGDGYWIAVVPGTYTNFGGVVLANNSFGVIARISGAFSLAQTTIIPTNMVTKPQASSVPFLKNPYDTFSTAEALTISAVKSVKVFNGDPTKSYRIRTLSQVIGVGNANNYKVIVDLADATIIINTNLPNTPTGINLFSKVGTDGSYWEFIVDYSVAPVAGYYINDLTSKIYIGPTAFQGADWNYLKNRPVNNLMPFLTNPAATFLATEIAAIAGVKSVRCYNGDPTKVYSLVTLANNSGANPYIINIYCVTTATTIAQSFAVPANTAGLSLMPLIGTDGSYWELIIDYSQLAAATVIINSFTSQLVFNSGIFIKEDYNKLLNLPGNVTKLIKQTIDGTQYAKPSDFYSAPLTDYSGAGVVVTLLTNQVAFLGPVWKIYKAGAGTNNYWRLFERGKVVPDKTKSLFVEFDYKIVTGTWLLKGFCISTTFGGGSAPAGSISASLGPADGIVRRQRIEITPTMLTNYTAGYYWADYFNFSGTNSEMWIGNIKIWQGAELVDKAGEENAKAAAALPVTFNVPFWAMGDSITYLASNWSYVAAAKLGLIMTNTACPRGTWQDRILGVTGTVSMSTTSAIVTGVGTTFTTDFLADHVLLDSTGAVILGTVLSIQSDTQLTLTANALFTKAPGTVIQTLPYTSFPDVNTPGRSAIASNSIRQFNRLYAAGGIAAPQLIVMCWGTNDAGSTTSYDNSNYAAIMAVAHYTDLTIAQKCTLCGGLRYNIEWVMNLFPNALIFLGTPLKSGSIDNTKLDSTSVAIKQMAAYYNCQIINFHDEVGITPIFEPGRWLQSDGVHPNAAGQILQGNYGTNRILDKYYSKT